MDSTLVTQIKISIPIAYRLSASLQNAQFFVTGTLGLAYPKTAEAMTKAVQIAKEGPCQVGPKRILGVPQPSRLNCNDCHKFATQGLSGPPRAPRLAHTCVDNGS